MIIFKTETDTFFYETVNNVLGQRASDDIKFYITNLLVRMCQWEPDPEPLAVRVFGHKQPRLLVLRDAGDEALFISGWFPEHLRSRGLARSYYRSLGSIAYHELAKERWAAASIYAELSKAFCMLQDALEDVREAQIILGMDKLSVLDVWCRTHSRASEQRLTELGVIVEKKILVDI